MNAPAEVGQTWASNRPQDIAASHNQERRVLALTTKKRWNRAEGAYDEVPAALMTGGGHGGTMKVRIALTEHGTIPNHRLVSDPDPRMLRLAQMLRGIQTRDPYRNAYLESHGLVQTRDLSDEVLSALLWPRQKDGTQNPRVEVVLHQDALLAVTQRIAELVEVVEQNAAAAMVGLLDEIGEEPEAA